MKERWLPVGILAGGLFAMNVIARWVVRLFADDDAGRTRIGLIALIAVAVVMAGAAYWWARLHPMPRVVADLAVAGLVGCLLSVVVGPLTVGSAPVSEGVDFFIGQIVRYVGLAIGGTFFGLLIVMAMGQDWKSQSWKRYAEQMKSKPRRVVRR